MVYKAVHPGKSSEMQSQIPLRANERLFRIIRATLAAGRIVARGCAGWVRRDKGANLAKTRHGGGAAGGARILDPRGGRIGPICPRLTVDPLSDRNRLSAVQLHRPRRQSRRFNVDLARQLCDEIKVSCTVQMRRFETLLDAIASNRGGRHYRPRWR